MLTVFSTRSIPRLRKPLSLITRRCLHDRQDNARFDSMGVPMRYYIPPSFKNYPSPLNHPIKCIKLLGRRIFHLGRNTFIVAVARLGGMKPQFLLWKNEAIDIFVNVNKAFANRRIESVNQNLTVWTRSHLLERQKSLPAKFTFDWKLVKIASPPKLQTVLPVPLHGRGGNDTAILVYKLDTVQRLIKLDKVTGETQSVDDRIENILVYVVDLDTNEMKLCGSTFESGIDESATLTQPANPGEVMKIQGDIYRIDDEGLKEAIEQEF